MIAANMLLCSDRRLEVVTIILLLIERFSSPSHLMNIARYLHQIAFACCHFYHHKRG